MPVRGIEDRYQGLSSMQGGIDERIKRPVRNARGISFFRPRGREDYLPT
jgi:hypothetical protein